MYQDKGVTKESRLRQDSCQSGGTLFMSLIRTIVFQFRKSANIDPQIYI